MPTKKPKLGQNFLRDSAACHRIVDALGDISEATVLEIGPGRGALTNILASRARRFVVVELDRSLAAHLSEAWRNTSSVAVISEDFLNIDVAALAREYAPNKDEKFCVIGNLPYYITSDILLHLFAHADSIQRAVVMVQEEVGDRLSARPGVRDYGVLSVTAQMHGRMEKLFTLPPAAFSPPPKVNSAVVRVDMRPRFTELGVDRAGFLRFIQSCFHQKRKTLANNLKSAGIPPTQIGIALADAGIDPNARAETVSLERMARVYRTLQPRIEDQSSRPSF